MAAHANPEPTVTCKVPKGFRVGRELHPQLRNESLR